MSTIKCSIKDCDEVYTTNEVVSPNAVFVCKKHPREEQVNILNRVYDPILDNIDQNAKFQKYQFPHMDNDSLKALEVFGFYSNLGKSLGFQIVSPKVRGDDADRLIRSFKRSEDRISSDWTDYNPKIRDLLLRSFPNLETNQLQRMRASRWCRVIYFYFRLRFTTSQIAEEMGLEELKIRRILRSIGQAASGRRANGLGPIVGKKGRPRKK